MYLGMYALYCHHRLHTTSTMMDEKTTVFLGPVGLQIKLTVTWWFTITMYLVIHFSWRSECELVLHFPLGLGSSFVFVFCWILVLL